MSNLLLDLDGTILDCRTRVYGLFTELVPQNDLSLNRYWDIKRSGQRQADLLRDRFGFDGQAVTDYQQSWLAHIEDEIRLDTDVLFPGLEYFLTCQARDKNLYLVTNRQFEGRALQQIKRLGVSQYFKKILVTGQRLSKADLVRQVGIAINPTDLFLGDTGEDVLTAHALGCRAGAVSWGFLDGNALACYQPDFIAQKVEDLAQHPFLQS